jgi:hypothetical protein
VSRRKCSVCASENITQINALMEAGLKLKSLATQFPGTSPYALSRHRRNCLEPAPADASPTGGILAEAERWMARADSQYLTASGVDGDTKSALQACQIAFRGIETRLRAQEREDEDEPETGDNAPITVAQLDAIIASVETKSNATPHGRALSELQLAPDRILEIAMQMHRDPELLREVERCYTERAYGQVQ